MPNAYILSQIPANAGPAVSLLVEMLVAAGWSYRQSGDGLAGYSATGKVFTGTGTGAGGWHNARAWARLSAPDNRREVCIQHNAAQGLRLKYSATAKFTGGAPSATTTPSATDERVLWGAGTDASPTLSAWFASNITSAGQKCHGMASSAAPYGFWFVAAAHPAGAIGCGVMLDPIESVPEDPDPIVWHIGTTLAFTVNGGLGQAASNTYPPSGSTQQGCWGHMDVAMSQFLYVTPGAFIGGCVNAAQCNGFQQCVSSAGLTLNPFNGKHEALPALYMRNALVGGLTNTGIKGWSRFMRWTTIARVHAQDTIDNLKWICIGSVWMPWDGLTPPTN